MPSVTKIIHFFLSALLTAISVGLLGFAMSDDWSRTTMDCRGFITNNGSAEITLGLFNGFLERQTCPSFGNYKDFSVFTELSVIKGASLALHALCVALLVLCLLFSALSILISLYNSVSNPYQTYMGPIGVYTCSSISACLSLLVIILFVLNINVTDMQEQLVPQIGSIDTDNLELSNKKSTMLVGYFMLIPYTVLSVGAILAIYLYDHAAYMHRREQEKPTEDAPKEIMMY
ncbi:clarin-3 [Cyprinodon tularosa]|uniref:clarin-3 n=1 Tax=Cyprinodon tularosa TaxID=77115 RepID=UPI0018E27153|nr:clarin-3 [Cyprinodon tularosa]